MPGSRAIWICAWVRRWRLRASIHFCKSSGIRLPAMTLTLYLLFSVQEDGPSGRDSRAEPFDSPFGCFPRPDEFIGALGRFVFVPPSYVIRDLARNALLL